MFTKQQLDVLIQAQAGDDWTPEYFPQRVILTAYDSDISATEYDKLIATLRANAP